MQPFVVTRNMILVAVLMSPAPTSATNPEECSSAAETGGACPRHGVAGGVTPLFVDCDRGLAFFSGFSDAKTVEVYIPQLDDGIDVRGDVRQRHQEDGTTTVFLFDPERFSADPVECARQVRRAASGLFGSVGCLSHAECAEGASCIGVFGCAFFCGFGLPMCPSDLVCHPLARWCVLPRIAVGPSNMVETARATPPTTLVTQVTAHGVLDLLDETEGPTGKKVVFRGNGRIVSDENFIPVEHEVSIELREYSGP